MRRYLALAINAWRWTDDNFTVALRDFFRSAASLNRESEECRLGIRFRDRVSRSRKVPGETLAIRSKRIDFRGVPHEFDTFDSSGMSSHTGQALPRRVIYH